MGPKDQPPLKTLCQPENHTLAYLAMDEIIMKTQSITSIGNNNKKQKKTRISQLFSIYMCVRNLY